MTDHKLTRLAAERIMQWRKNEQFYMRSQLGPGDRPLVLTSMASRRQWSPLSDWDAAAQIIAKMQANGWTVITICSHDYSSAQLEKCVDGSWVDFTHVTTADNCPHAITAAALLAVGAITEKDLTPPAEAAKGRGEGS